MTWITFFFAIGVVIWAGIMLAFCFLVLTLGKKIFNIGREDLRNFNGSFTPFVFTVWGLDVAALEAASILALILSMTVDYFSITNDEWGIAHAGAQEQAGTLIGLWTVFYFGFLLLSYLMFKKNIADPNKRVKLFCWFAAISVFAFFLVMFFIVKTAG
jgi:hypothetical protein